MSWEFEKVAGPYQFTEGPAWDGSGMLFTDIPNNRIMRFDPETGETVEHISNTNEGNGLLFDKDGLLYVCEGGGRCMSRYDGGGTRTVLCDSFEGKRLNSPNDVAIDTQGRAWFTDPRYGANRDDMEQGHESVFRLDPQGDGSWPVKRMTLDTTRPNGLLVSPDCKTLYVAESDPGEGEKRELRAYPIKDDDTLGDYEILHNFFPHRGIDGMCLDVEGNLVATAGSTRSGPGPMIYVFAPSGRVLETHPVAVDPTNCTFGDADLQTLYVTNAAGELWRARTHRKGWLIYPSNVP